MVRPILALPLALLLSCAAPVKRTTAAPPPPAEAQAPTADTLLASDSVRTRSFSDSFPDAVSYPGTELGPIVDGPSAKLIQQVITSRHGGPSQFSHSDYASQRHPLLGKALPGASFARVFIQGLLPELRRTDKYVVAGSKVHGLDDLNRLLLDAGFSFDSTEIPTITKIAVLFATFGKTLDASGQLRDAPMPTDSTPGAGFPAITFLSMDRETKQYSGAVGQGMRVRCIIDGVRVNPFVALDGADKWGRRQVRRVFGSGLNLMVWAVGPLPPPKGK